MKLIPLTQGKFAIVDDEDFDLLNQWKWGYTHGYARRTGSRPEQQHIYMHRIILKVGVGQMVDHKNTDSLDNRKENLRLCTKSSNGMNRGKNKNNTSGYKGVELATDHKRRKPWSARIGFQGKQIKLGSFSTPQEASIAYNVAAMKYHKEYALY